MTPAQTGSIVSMETRSTMTCYVHLIWRHAMTFL